MRPEGRGPHVIFHTISNAVALGLCLPVPKHLGEVDDDIAQAVADDAGRQTPRAFVDKSSAQSEGKHRKKPTEGIEMSEGKHGAAQHRRPSRQDANVKWRTKLLGRAPLQQWVRTESDRQNLRNAAADCRRVSLH